MPICSFGCGFGGSIEDVRQHEFEVHGKPLPKGKRGPADPIIRPTLDREFIAYRQESWARVERMLRGRR